jgi:hypothetical protein
MHNWAKNLILIFLDQVVEGLGNDNMTKVIMQVLMISGGVQRNQIAQKLICFGANGVNVFQGTKSGVTQQMKEFYALHSIGVHCMAHHTNLAVQTLHSYFAHLPKRHLELQNLQSSCK